jgi:hypothetical protein
MDVHRYLVRVKHDNGIVNIKTTATSEEWARKVVMKAEGCPERAIISVQWIGTLNAPVPTVNELTEEERAALLAFAKEHGRTWKSKLLLGWETAKYPGPLQALRNNYGPEWLRLLKLPKV